MVNIDFGDGYKLMQADERNIILCKDAVVEKPKSKNYGKTVVHRMGYYGTLAHALNAYKNARVMEAKTICNDAKILAELLRQIDDTIREVCGK